MLMERDDDLKLMHAIRLNPCSNGMLMEQKKEEGDEWIETS